MNPAADPSGKRLEIKREGSLKAGVRDQGPVARVE